MRQVAPAAPPKELLALMPSPCSHSKVADWTKLSSIFFQKSLSCASSSQQASSKPMLSTNLSSSSAHLFKGRPRDRRPFQGIQCNSWLAHRPSDMRATCPAQRQYLCRCASAQSSTFAKEQCFPHPALLLRSRFASPPSQCVDLL